MIVSQAVLIAARKWHIVAHRNYIVSYCDGVGIYTSLPPIPASNQAISQADFQTRCLAQLMSCPGEMRRNYIPSFYKQTP